jgi:hypothetical protein
MWQKTQRNILLDDLIDFKKKINSIIVEGKYLKIIKNIELCY